jgi:hypothetical protein
MKPRNPHPEELNLAYEEGRDSLETDAENPYNLTDYPELYCAFEQGKYDTKQLT